MYFTNGFYLYRKYLKPHLMAHCCNFAEPAAPLPGGRGAAGTYISRQGGGWLPPKASVQIKIIFIYI
jgi:hypothetical protein